MAKNIKIKIDVDSEQVEFAGNQTLTLTEKVRALRKELQRVPEGTAEWRTLNKAYNENKDALDRVNIKSRELFGTLSALPGPLGSVAGGLDRNIDLLKTFSSIKQEDLKKGLVGVGQDIKEVGKSIANLTGLTKVYEVATAGASKALQFFGVSATGASTAAKGFGLAISGLLAATGLILLTTLVTQVAEAYEYFSTKAERAAEQQKKLNESIQKGNEAALDAESAFVKRSNELLKAQAKARGASADEIYKIDQSGRKLLLESQKRYLKNIKDQDSDAARTAIKNIKDTENEIKVAEANFQAESLAEKKKASDKTAELSKKDKETREADIKELQKAERDALLSLMSNKEKELGEVDDKYKEIIAKEQKYGRDTKLLVEARDNEKKKIREKYAEEEKAYIERALQDIGDKQQNARNKELNEAELAYKKIYDQKVLAKEDTTKIDEAYAQQVLGINKKYDEEELKQKNDFFSKVRDIEIAAGQNQTQRLIEARQKKLQDDTAAIEKDKEFLKLSLEEQNNIRKNLVTASENDIKAIKEKAFEDEKTKIAKQYSDQLQLLDIQGQSLIRGTKAYNDNRKEILDASQAQELNAIKVSADATIAEQERADAARTAINEKYTKLRKNQALSEAIYIAEQISKGLEAAKGVANAILAVNDAKMAQELKAAGEDEAKKDEIKKKYFEKNKKAQIALAYINTFQSAVSAFAAMAPIPVVGPALAAIAAAAAIVAGLANVAKIKASTYEGGTAGGGGSGSAIAATPAMTAPQQAQVPNIGASVVSSEGRIGQIVNSAATQQGTRPIQTYVVGNQVSSQQQLDRRVSLAAKMAG